MAQKKKTQKSSGSQARGRTAALYALRLLLWIAVPGILLIATGMGLKTVWHNIANRPEFRLDPNALRFTSKPDSLRSGPILQALQKEIRGVLSDTPIFKRDICHAVQHELRASPWILDVQAVRRQLPDRLSVTAVFRTPAAIVKYNGQDYMIDTWGYWLPEKFYRFPEEWKQDPPPVITHRELRSPPVPGERWDGIALAIGARFARFLNSQNIIENLLVTEIDVTNIEKPGLESDIVLKWKNGTEIKWGGSDIYSQFKGLQRSPDEFKDETKLHMLQQMLKEHPGLEGLEYVDLRFNKIYYRPITESRSQTDEE
jgi:hypothetical protein